MDLTGFVKSTPFLVWATVMLFCGIIIFFLVRRR